MEVIYPILKVFDLDQTFLEVYIECWFKKCEETSSCSQIRVRKGIKFITELIEKGFFDPSRKIQSLQSIIRVFEHIKGVKDFQNILNPFMR